MHARHLLLSFLPCLLLACSSTTPPTGDDDEPLPDGGPMALPSATATQVAVGGAHLCALTTAGGVRCWGTTYHGEVGNGGPIDSTFYYVPVQVVGLSAGVQAISSHDGAHTCALTTAGAVKCWGDDTFGQLGSGVPRTSSASTNSSTPIDVAGLSSGVKAIAVGSEHACAITAAGGVKCWGNNEYGQLGDDTNDDTNTPVDVIGLSSGVTAIAAGSRHSCAITAQGGLKCWGSNVYGELGIDTTDTEHIPVDVIGMQSGVTAVSTGRFSSCAVVGGAARCWGLNDHGQVGNGVTSSPGGGGEDMRVPTPVLGLEGGVTAISTTYQLACAVASGAAKCWGDNSYGNFGNDSEGGFQSYVPVTATGLASGTVAIGAGTHHVCAVTSAGAVLCWGESDGAGGPLGGGTNANSKVPVAVVSLP